MNAIPPIPPYLSGFDPVPDSLLAHLWDKGLPFHLHGTTLSRAVVVCFHGFCASPFETRPIADACQAQGLDAVAPLLPGHGFSDVQVQNKAILTMSMENAIEACRAEIARARETYNVVNAYGQSMGGALALVMAAEGLVDAVATTAPAIKLPAGTGFLTTVFGSFDIKKRRVPNPNFFNLSYEYKSSKAAKQLLRIANHAKSMLDAISCPCLVVHSRNDKTIDPVVTGWIKERATGTVDVAWFDESDHTMPLDVKGSEVSETIARFFKHHEGK